MAPNHCCHSASVEPRATTEPLAPNSGPGHQPKRCSLYDTDSDAACTLATLSRKLCCRSVRVFTFNVV